MNKISFDEVWYLPEQAKTFSANLSAEKMVRHMMETCITSRQKQMIRLYYMDKKSMSEIAQLLGVNKSTVSRTVSRGIAKLKQYLDYESCE